MAEMLKGKRILVTGAARGLGRSVAEAAAAEGARLVISDILETELAQTAEALRERGAEVEALVIDQADPASIEAGMARIAEGGALDGLVNNAAIATGVGGETMMDYDMALWDRVMAVNVRGTWLMTRAAVPLLEANGGGRVVNLASDTALWGAPRLMAYVASKGAVISMTRSMARELGERRIGVNAVAPGLTHCEATEYVPQERYDYYTQGRALKREQQPDDVDGTILYLLSDWSTFVTGQVIPINGGFVFN
ncbi:SDR family oxidoreductase [Halomonas organivorans]|uniref:NAD(P)-dependent dehydrogenase (Short-subunit alcohol dehydrogenase family) n=1 Tax=Halomonas organivorans TaxID=257772 RepID=A0A7W5G5S2_9GAMM|nr:SDR family oxidoreductase [Halomonas organivorans]MBB3141395.1 NAD(P)-dependent dehydrogenase (short-subunit alcohol dehydrogenase family) [Halomonas organivorans]